MKKVFEVFDYEGHFWVRASTHYEANQYVIDQCQDVTSCYDDYFVLTCEVYHL